jgi:hypothetical protein
VVVEEDEDEDEDEKEDEEEEEEEEAEEESRGMTSTAQDGSSITSSAYSLGPAYSQCIPGGPSSIAAHRDRKVMVRPVMVRAPLPSNYALVPGATPHTRPDEWLPPERRNPSMNSPYYPKTAAKALIRVATRRLQLSPRISSPRTEAQALH